MTFSRAVGTCLEKYAVFSGRAGRAEYWWFFLFNLVVSLLASILDAGVLGADSFRIGLGPAGDQGLVATLVSLLLFVPNLSVGARRLHDIGRSGWWLLLGLVPCVGLIVLIVFFATRGEPHPNRYGDVPA